MLKQKIKFLDKVIEELNRDWTYFIQYPKGTNRDTAGAKALSLEEQREELNQILKEVLKNVENKAFDIIDAAAKFATNSNEYNEAIVSKIHSIFAQNFSSLLKIYPSNGNFKTFEMKIKTENIFSFKDYAELKVLETFESIQKDILENPNFSKILEADDFSFKVKEDIDGIFIDAFYKDKFINWFSTDVVSSTRLCDDIIETINRVYEKLNSGIKLDMYRDDGEFSKLELSDTPIMTRLMPQTDYRNDFIRGDNWNNIDERQNKIIILNDNQVYFDGRIDLNIFNKSIDEAVSKYKFNKEDLNNLTQYAFNYAMDNFWQGDYLENRLYEFLKEENLYDKLNVIHRKGKDFYIVDSFDTLNAPMENDVIYDNTVIELHEATQADREKLLNELQNIKKGLEQEMIDEFEIRVEDMAETLEQVQSKKTRKQR